MSGLDDRCAQFHEAAIGSGKSKGAAKEIATLRKFLYRNQTQRFSDKASARLLDAIAIFAQHEDGEGLLDDALKMPFTVFSTKQKSKMLKWMEERKRHNNGGDKSTAVPTKLILFSVIDVQGNKASLMNEETGESYEDVLLPDGELGEAIQKAFAASDEALDVLATLVGERVTIHNIKR
jgi:hypothetical protein